MKPSRRRDNPTRRMGPKSVQYSAASGRQDRWLLSYADFVTLLFALFVVLYASAKVDHDTSLALLEGISGAFVVNPIATGIPSGPEDASPQNPLARPIGGDETLLARLAVERIHEIRTGRGESLGVATRSDQRGLILSLASTEFFPAGGVEIPNDRKQILSELAPLLQATSRPIHFEGHTDDQPISAGPFPSNWELSAARAAAVARYFIATHKVDPERVATAGYAEYKPLIANLGPKERAQNRRVEIVLLYDAVKTSGTRSETTNRNLSELLESLPPLPEVADESFAPAPTGPEPADIPLP